MISLKVRGCTRKLLWRRSPNLTDVKPNRINWEGIEVTLADYPTCTHKKKNRLLHVVFDTLFAFMRFHF